MVVATDVIDRLTKSDVLATPAVAVARPSPLEPLSIAPATSPELTPKAAPTATTSTNTTATNTDTSPTDTDTDTESLP